MARATTIPTKPMHLLVGCPRCGAYKGSRCRNRESEAIDNIHTERNKRARELYPVSRKKEANG